MDTTEQVGIVFPEILIPDKRTNKSKWAVIACDQFTSNEDYWIKTEKIVGGAPSAMHIIVPEVFLHDRDIDERITHAKETMRNYIEDGVLVRLPKGVMLVERETPFGTRIGIVLAVDLEQYDTDYTARPLIRATEQTVADRIPPRIKLREQAVLECPHVMLMLDDPEDSVIGPVYHARGNHTKIYDTSLMQGGGHVKGWFIDDEDILGGIANALGRLKRKSKDGMLFAVGDGNHSLASAKAVWDEKKEEMPEEQRQNSPLRYALVEVINLFDHGISIQPIHRVLFGVEPPSALRMLVSILNDMGTDARMMYTRGARMQKKEGVQTIIFESKMSKGRIELAKPKHELLGITLTQALDRLAEELPKAHIDYIHGEEAFHELAKEHASLGFMMEPMSKEQLFESISKFGVLPRKMFSLGEAQEKRYYYECRLLVDVDSEADMEKDEELEEAVPPQEEPGMQFEPAEDEISDANASLEDQQGKRAVRRRKKGLFGRKR